MWLHFQTLEQLFFILFLIIYSNDESKCKIILNNLFAKSFHLNSMLCLESCSLHDTVGINIFQYSQTNEHAGGDGERRPLRLREFGLLQRMGALVVSAADRPPAPSSSWASSSTVSAFRLFVSSVSPCCFLAGLTTAATRPADPFDIDHPVHLRRGATSQADCIGSPCVHVCRRACMPR